MVVHKQPVDGHAFLQFMSPHKKGSNHEFHHLTRIDDKGLIKMLICEIRAIGGF
jgi:hypothetical protein